MSGGEKPGELARSREVEPMGRRVTGRAAGHRQPRALQCVGYGASDRASTRLAFTISIAVRTTNALSMPSRSESLMGVLDDCVGRVAVEPDRERAACAIAGAVANGIAERVAACDRRPAP